MVPNSFSLLNAFPSGYMICILILYGVEQGETSINASDTQLKEAEGRVSRPLLPGDTAGGQPVARASSGHEVLL